MTSPCGKESIDGLRERIAELEELIAAQHGDVVVRTAKLLYEKDDALASLQAENERKDAENAALRAKLDEAVGVLRPFAKMRNRYEQNFGKPDPETVRARAFLDKMGDA